ncbi:NlpC/P60 family protein (plasmid) [Streptomyces sp. NBC_01450]|uniref:C40 family peptidase n=1 Tax=Streptomyces sp. NBC_01450 TaxID=2903871 RepID=UPI002E35620C|nr:NlpC/P60 family protein [Streptomyces sp. NBC_01450]
MRRILRARGRRTAVGLTLLCALTATHSPALAAPKPGPTTLDEVRTQLDSLYHQAEVATEKYNAADEMARAQQKRVVALNGQMQQASQREAQLKQSIGAAVRAQYRSGGLSAEIQFALALDPERALDNAGLVKQAQQATLGQLAAMKATEKELRTRTTESTSELKNLWSSRRAMAKSRKTIEEHIARARTLETQLQMKDQQRLAALQKQRADKSQAKWVGTGILDQVGTKASAAGTEAIAYAAKQLGKPYVWGAAGPDSFDCSGLTSQAWLHAGIVLPRTSEEQWAQLPHVPVSKMRPGDLIVYFSDASHVALYIGDGQIISAPHPGGFVYVSAAGSMQILGAVRPDAD